MKMMTLTPNIIARERNYNKSVGRGLTGGVLVVQVIPGSPAEVGGLLAGDIIVEFDEKPVTNTRHILDRIGSTIGRSIATQVVRDGEVLHLAIRTAESTSL